jgi:diguanylate cyclase (GGDEF)-like protein
MESSERARDRALRDAERVRTAAIVASDIRFDTDVHLQALLDRAATAIRPDMTFSGIFGTIEGSEAVVLARTSNGDALIEGIAIGSRTPLAQTLLPEVLAADGPVGFDDLQASDVLESRPFAKASGARSAIATAFRAGAQTYFLRFTGDQPTAEPFDDIDCAYIDLLAKLFAQRLRQNQQSARLHFAMAHDGLTDLPNRATLRAAIVSSFAVQRRGALIVLDLDRFRGISLAFGHQTAEAIIVEIAIALRALLLPGESLGRTGGDVFTIYVPGAGHDAAVKRARQLSARFAHPFGTGDREGREQVRVTASLGVALYPHDANAVDELFDRADQAVDLAKAAGRDRIAFAAPALPARRR